MRTQLRWSKSASSWKCRRRSWTPVCLNRPIFTERFENAKVAITKSRWMPKEDADQINDEIVKLFLRRINAFMLPNELYQNLRPHALSETNESAVASSTTSSMVIDATLTNAPNATSTSPIMSSTSATPVSSYLTSLIYFTKIPDQLK